MSSIFWKREKANMHEHVHMLHTCSYKRKENKHLSHNTDNRAHPRHWMYLNPASQELHGGIQAQGWTETLNRIQIKLTGSCFIPLPCSSRGMIYFWHEADTMFTITFSTVYFKVLVPGNRIWYQQKKVRETQNTSWTGDLDKSNTLKRQLFR